MSTRRWGEIITSLCGCRMQDSMFKSGILKYFYNKYDFIIRFTYTQIPLIRDLLRKIMFWRMYSSDFKHIDETFVELEKTFDQYDITFKDKQIIELGPGNSIALALNCLCSGARKYLMADKYPRILKTEKQAKHLLEQVTYFESKYRCNLDNFINKDNLEFNESFLAYTPDSAEDLRNIPSHSIDIILSISVFEHIRDVENSFREMRRVLKEGGVMYHSIDMRDHYNFNEPFKFLKYSDFTWDNFLTKEGYSYTNRLRVDDFENLLMRYGFEIININKNSYEYGLPHKKSFYEKFRDKDIESLKVLGIKILAKNKFEKLKVGLI